VQSIAELVEQAISTDGPRAIGSEGLREGQWALVDFGSVVLHVFHQFSRQIYDLDGLWGRAPRLRLEPPKAAAVRGQ
jgi:ribosome-associated protein